MASPDVLASAAHGDGAAAGTSHTITLPAGIAAGNGILAFLSVANNALASTASDGFTKIFQSTAASNYGLAIFWKPNAAGGGSDSLVVSLASSQKVTAATYRISGHRTDEAPTVADVANGNNANPDPPLVSLPGGLSEDLLVFGAAAINASSTTTSGPAGYSGLVWVQGFAASNGQDGVCAAYRQVTAASEDPGTFQISPSAGRNWVSTSVAIRPAAVVSTRTLSLAATETGADSAAIDVDVRNRVTLAATGSGSDSAAVQAKALQRITLAATGSGADSAAINIVRPAGRTLALAATETGPDSAAVQTKALQRVALAATGSGPDTFAGDVDVRAALALAATEVGPDTFAASIGPVGVTSVPSIVQSKVTPIGTNAANPRAMALDAPATAGSWLILFALHDKASSVSTPTGWTAEAGLSWTAGTGASGTVFTRKATGGEQAIALDLSPTSSATTFVALELAGAHGTSPLDVKVMATDFTSSASQTLPLMSGVTAFADELAIAVISSESGSSTDTATAGFTNGFTPLLNYMMGTPGDIPTSPSVLLATKDVPASGTTVSTTGSATGDASDQLIGYLLTIRPAAGADPGRSLSLAAIEAGPDTAALDVDARVRASLAAQEAGPDSAAVLIRPRASLALAAQETGPDGFTGAIGSPRMLLALSAQETGPDTAQGQFRALNRVALSALSVGADTMAAQVAARVRLALAAQGAGADTIAADVDVRVRFSLTAQGAGADGFSGSAGVRVRAALASQEVGADGFTANLGSPRMTLALIAQEVGPDSFAGDLDVRARLALAAIGTGADTFAGTATVRDRLALNAQEIGADTGAAVVRVRTRFSLSAVGAGADTFAATLLQRRSLSVAAVEAGPDQIAAALAVASRVALAAAEEGADVFASGVQVVVAVDMIAGEDGTDSFVGDLRISGLGFDQGPRLSTGTWAGVRVDDGALGARSGDASAGLRHGVGYLGGIPGSGSSDGPREEDGVA